MSTKNNRTFERNDEVIEIETFTKEGLEIPKCQRYKIRIDNEKYIVETGEMSGRQLLELANKVPFDQYAIFQRLKGGQTKKIEYDEIVNFRTPGIERFMTLPLDQTEGLDTRRQFTLTEDDNNFFETHSLEWEAVVEGNIKRIVIRGFEVPHGYNVDKVDLNVRIESTYPDTQIDMVYFFPKLSRVDAKAIKAIAEDEFDGKTWQRWSRHRSTQNPWRPATDNLETHLFLVNEWLKLELQK